MCLANDTTLSKLLALGTVIFASMILCDSESRAQPWQPADSDFQVNSITTDSQLSPSISRAPDGRSAVAWTSLGAPLSGEEEPTSWIFSRFYGSDGTPVGPEVQVSPFQGALPESAPGDSNDFVMVWTGFDSTDASGDPQVLGRRLDSAGQPVGDEFLINETTAGQHSFPTIDSSADGSFVVVWGTVGAGSYDVEARRLDAAGDPVGGEFLVSAQTSGEQAFPDVAVAPSGDFLVVWQSSLSDGSDSSGTSIQGRRFDSAGSPLGGDFQINTGTLANQLLPAAASLPGDRYVVVWESEDESPERIKGQVVDSTGGFVGGEFVVDAAASRQYRPAVDAAPGGFLVAWETSEGDADGSSINTQAFDLSGAPRGDAFQVNSYTPGDQQYPALSADANGDFLVVWQSFGSPDDDQDGTAILARPVRDVIFEDGFESGDVSLWSASVP